MYISVKGQNVHINKHEFESCRKVVSKFIDSVREQAKGNLSPSYYFTLLITGHIMFQEMLDDFDIDTIVKIMDSMAVEENDT